MLLEFDLYKKKWKARNGAPTFFEWLHGSLHYPSALVFVIFKSFQSTFIIMKMFSGKVSKFS